MPARELSEPAHADALVIRYAGWPRRHRLSPLGLVVDYLVRARGPRELFVGKAYLERRGRRVRRVLPKHFLLAPARGTEVASQQQAGPELRGSPEFRGRIVR